MPELDLYTWRDPSMKSGAPHTDAYRRSGRNSPIGLAIEEETPERYAIPPCPSSSSLSRTGGTAREEGGGVAHIEGIYVIGC